MENKEVSGCLEKRHRFKFESYGVKIGVESNDESFLKRLEDHLPNVIPNVFVTNNNLETEHIFSIDVSNDGLFVLYKDDEKITAGDSQENFFNFSCSKLRLTVAEFAKEKVFLHAGVIGWNGKAIIFPAQSFQGKSTLVSKLVQRGALYYSDEYAVLDEKGFVYPFPKTLSLRGKVDKYKQTEYTAESFGGKIGTEPLEVGMILLTGYEPGAEWKPELLSAGKAILEIVPHTIPIRNNPKFSLQVLNKIVNRAIIAKSKRGEAEKFIDLLLKFYETKVI
jgi:hypothetical protein